MNSKRSGGEKKKRRAIGAAMISATQARCEGPNKALIEKNQQEAGPEQKEDALKKEKTRSSTITKYKFRRAFTRGTTSKGTTRSRS